MAVRQIFLGAGFCLLFLQLVSSASSRDESYVGNDIKRELGKFNNKFGIELEKFHDELEIEKVKMEFKKLLNSFWGGHCVVDDVCYSEISYCNKGKISMCLKEVELVQAEHIILAVFGMYCICHNLF